MAAALSRFAQLTVFCAVIAVGSSAGALQITGLSVVLGGTNTVDNTMDSGQNRAQNTSAVSTVLAPGGPVADTPGSFTDFITRYALLVAADRENTTSNTTRTMTSSYQITFTVDNPTGANLQIDIDTLRVGSLTNISDDAGNSTITLDAVTGQLNAVTEPGLGAPAIAPFTSSASAQTTFSQAGTTLTILTNAITSSYVLDFDWTSSVVSTRDEGAIRMGISGGLSTTTADDYPGVAFPRTASDDGHFVDVTVTLISVPEARTAALLALGLLGLASKARIERRARAPRR